ncbi:YebC/PmpR family DNA-binding transcriptional regulator [Candidatus Dependentiae bacterium]|nr:YebC/PmpR family DNA-binding transcriptional regulator [Candidatus Dependentiae bacterium]
MSGHSKWATIKHKKAKEDAKRGKVFTKLIKEITVAARDGGGDPTANARLRMVVEKAKTANMPQENIVRAIKKGTGELEGVSYEAATYEGYGPHGVAVIVETLSDNKKRTVSEVRHLFSKMGGNLGEAGSVAWMFEHKGVVRLPAANISEDELLEKLLDYDVEDVVIIDNVASIVCDMKDLELIKKGAEQEGLSVEDADIEWVPKNKISLESQDQESKVYKFLDAIEELDDVQNVYANLV